jgi:hypothetical protein
VQCKLDYRIIHERTLLEDDAIQSKLINSKSRRATKQKDNASQGRATIKAEESSEEVLRNEPAAEATRARANNDNRGHHIHSVIMSSECAVELQAATVEAIEAGEITFRMDVVHEMPLEQQLQEMKARCAHLEEVIQDSLAAYEAMVRQNEAFRERFVATEIEQQQHAPPTPFVIHADEDERQEWRARVQLLESELERKKKEAEYWQQQAQEHEEISNYERNLIKQIKTLDERLYNNAVQEYNNTMPSSSSSSTTTSIPTMDMIDELNEMQAQESTRDTISEGGVDTNRQEEQQSSEVLNTS